MILLSRNALSPYCLHGLTLLLAQPVCCALCLLPAFRPGNRQIPYTFSTWPNSSSTGVARPKIVTETRRRDFS
ncbi:hypothetical protein LMG23992_03825 [Cupriavidus laharis]|uniref:Secreted protein n=1 Tax=Cupriavidus laharis TaxID=151654 RepID=A0ABN7Z2D6_9BURK|nr:hypothetical protein LMG23992_03825 [Cupriavidus laharis]